MYTFKNIQSALEQPDYNFFVISDNEVHAFEDITDALKDVDQADDRNITVELLDRKSAMNKYL